MSNHTCDNCLGEQPNTCVTRIAENARLRTELESERRNVRDLEALIARQDEEKESQRQAIVRRYGGYRGAPAATAVADEGMRVARMETTQLVAGQYVNENARLRAKVEESATVARDLLRQRNGSEDENERLRAELEYQRAKDASDKALNRGYRARWSKSEATIARVRSVLESEQQCQESLDPSDRNVECNMCGRDLLALIRAALGEAEGEQNAG